MEGNVGTHTKKELRKQAEKKIVHFYLLQLSKLSIDYIATSESYIILYL